MQTTRLQFTTPEKLGKKGDPKKDTYGWSQEGKIVKISWVNWEVVRREGMEYGNIRD